jgi:hypothetical protein
MLDASELARIETLLLSTMHDDPRQPQPRVVPNQADAGLPDLTGSPHGHC